MSDNQEIRETAPDGLQIPVIPIRTSLEKYMYHASQFVGHEDPTVDAYAQQLVKNTQDLHNGVITLDQYVSNTPHPPVQESHEALHPHRMMLHMRKMIEQRHPIEYKNTN
jgi:hypothetical protein